MKIRDLLPFHWKKEKPVEVQKVPQTFNRALTPFDRLFEDFDHLFSEPFGSLGLQGGWGKDGLSPNVNVSETKKEIKVEAELPGMDEKDFNVSIDNGNLTLRGEKKHENRDEKAHKMECAYGFFERTLPLPKYAKMEEAKAKYKNGVLTIQIPKDPKQETERSIPVSVGSTLR